MEQRFENLHPKKEIVSGEAVDSFISDLEQYDREHDPARKMGGFLAGLMMSHMDNGEGAREIAEEIKNSITVDDLIKRNITTLQKMGLDLESPNKNGDVDMNEQFVSGAVMVHLFDKELYVEYLKSLETGRLSSAQEKLLGIITKKIAGQIQHEYELDNADDQRLFEIFSGLREIVAEYERLGLIKEVGMFKDYLDYMNSGYLREYILVTNNNVFGEIGSGFNLSTFQRDCTGKSYLEYWDRKFFKVLDDVRKNPAAKELEEKMIKHAKESIAFAETDPKLNNYDEKYLESIRPAIIEVEARLAAL